MKKLWICGIAACLGLFVSSGAFAQEFEFSFDGPSAYTGAAGSVHAATYTVNLGHQGTADNGATSWSYGVEVVGGVATSATTDGTTVQEVYRDGFNTTEVIDPARNDGRQGAVSAVVLRLQGGVQLPPNQVSSILLLGTEFTVPAGGGSGRFRIAGIDDPADRLTGGGQPVDVNIAPGNTFTVQELEIALVEEVTCCGAEYNVGFSGARVLSSVPGEGIADDSDTCSATGTLTVGPGSSVFFNASSDSTDAISGWSLSIEVTGDIAITDVTTDGTSGAPAPDGKYMGGFTAVGLADPEKSGGRRGAVGAVVLGLNPPQFLDAVGTESLLNLTVDTLDPAAESASGEIFVGEPLTGAGTPVDNILTVSGGDAEVCNLGTARVAVTVEDTGVGPFRRGDCNNDGIVDIADPVWSLNELFREGPASPCQIACDSNDDGAIDLADATYTIAYEFSGGPPPAAPFAECGSVDESALTCDDSSACDG